jgi:bromodomain adjacent to zinc finger domain protein 1A
MPTCRRKRVLLIDTPPALLQALKSDPNKHVYYLAKTAEIFDSYEQASIPSFSTLES